MDDKEFAALVRLLDDDDPSVQELIRKRLTAMGKDGIERLELAWETEQDLRLRQRIESMLGDLSFGEVADELLAWRKGGGNDLLEGWRILSRFQFPDFDFLKCRNEISRLASKSWLEINPGMNILQKLKVLNHMFFEIEGYKPAEPLTPGSYYLPNLVETRQGHVFSLTLLFIIVANKLEYGLQGVLMPGYFMAYHTDGTREIYVDVYNKGNFYSRNDIEKFLETMGSEKNPAFMKPTSNIYIILQMIRQLAHDYEKAGREDRSRALRELLVRVDIHF